MTFSLRHNDARLLFVLAISLVLAGCGGSGATRRAPRVQTGTASYLAHSLHGNHTASGERYNERKLTAAHRTLPFGTRVRVTNLRNGKKVVVRINDRGPFTRGRIIDLSYGAARKLGFVRDGLTEVKLEIMRAP